MEAACTLTVQTKVLGVGLCYKKLEALFDKVADGPVVGAEGARSETLVSTVEERELLSLLHHRGNLLPLILRRVDTSGVVCAGMEEHNASFGCRFECADHSIEVKALGVFAKVWVVLDRKMDVRENLVVVCPCWRAEVNRLCLRCRRVVELLQEQSTKVVGASAGDGLEGGNTLL